MNAYKFVFAVGLLNVIVPFLGIPFAFKQYALVTLGAITLMYALYQRALVKEREAGLSKPAKAPADAPEGAIKTIEQVVEMKEPVRIAGSDVKPKRRGRRPKVAVQEQAYE